MALPFKKCEPWLRSLKGSVDLHRITTPIRVKREKPLSLPTGDGRRPISATQFDFAFRYRDTRGEDREGLARAFVPTKRPRERLPTIVYMHYEIDANGAARFLKRGWAVITPTGKRSYNAMSFVGSSINHCVAMAQLPRRMPFVDQGRLMIYGVSAGGYHALMASSFVFPVNAVVALVPPLNLKYNINFLLRNDQYNVDPSDRSKPAAPAVKGVTVFAAETAKAGRLDAQNWSHFSPVYRTGLMTYPTLMTYFTGDVAVPVNQVSMLLAHRPPKGSWPKGFSFEMEDCVPDPDERATLLEALRPRGYYLKVVKVPESTPDGRVKSDEMTEEQRSAVFKHSVKWSPAKRFSLYVSDEGHPEPFCGHSKYHHRLNDMSFFEHHLTNPLSPGVLTKAKLGQVMERLKGTAMDMGTQWEGEESWPICRRDHECLEMWYVVSGLEAYLSGGPRHQKRLCDLYRALPKRLKVLDLGDTPAARFDKSPAKVLLQRQLLLLLRDGDMEVARYVMSQIVRRSHDEVRS